MELTSGASNDASEKSVGNSTGPCEMPHREGTFRARKPQHNSPSYLDRVSSVREEETLDLELFCQTGVPEGELTKRQAVLFGCLGGHGRGYFVTS